MYFIAALARSGAILTLLLTLVLAHPFCKNDDPPDIPSPPLNICKGFNSYPGACCDVDSEFVEVYHPRGRMMHKSNPAERLCRKRVSALLCAICSPLSGHIFGSETGYEKEYPTLCAPFCKRFYDACADQTFWTSAKLIPVMRIPGLRKGNGTVKIRDLFPTVDSYCYKFGSIDAGACYTDKPGERLAPPLTGKNLRLTRMFPLLDLQKLVSIPNPLTQRHHILDFSFFEYKNTKMVAAVFQTGKIVAFVNGNSTSNVTLMLDIYDKMEYTEAENGLMGVAFDPKFKTNGYAYIKYNPKVSWNVRISRFKLYEDRLAFDPLSERVLLDIPRYGGTAHQAGVPVFSDDGLLFIALGDGKVSPYYTLSDSPAVNMTSLLGKILRIDTRASALQPNNWTGPLYTIPASNPFAKNENGIPPEIWASGVRNPWRITWDPVHHELWGGDVGHTRYEEINLFKAGGDYGWNRMEGNVCFFPAQNCTERIRNITAYEGPIVVHPHISVCGNQAPGLPCLSSSSITGGYWYRGTSASFLRGRYIYADYESGTFFALTIPNRSKPRENVVVERLIPLFDPGTTPPRKFKPAAFAEDLKGEVYVANWLEPKIYKLVEDPFYVPPNGAARRSIMADGLGASSDSNSATESTFTETQA